MDANLYVSKKYSYNVLTLQVEQIRTIEELKLYPFDTYSNQLSHSTLKGHTC